MVFGTTPNKIYLYLHSCRYYSNKKKATVLVNIYPDIKWTLELSFNFTNPIAYTHANLPEYSRTKPLDEDVERIKREQRKAQSKAVSSGKETARMLRSAEMQKSDKKKNSPEMLSRFGLKLGAKWDNEKQEAEYGEKSAKKLRKVLNVFLKYKEIADKVKTTLGGAAKKAPGALPFMFEVEAPSLNASIEWYLERGTEEYASQIATVGTLNFKADPLVGAKFKIDLLALGSRMHPFVAAMVAGIEGGLATLNGGITIEAKFYGKFAFDYKAFEINSLTGVKGGKLDLGAKFGIKIIEVTT